MQNPLAKQDRIEQDFDGSFYLIRKASKSKDFSIDFGEGGRSRIQILQARIWRKIRERLLLGCSIRSCLAKWSNMWSSLIFTAVFGKEKSLKTFCFKTFSVVEATGLEAYQGILNPFIYKASSVCSPIVHQTVFI